MIGVLVTGTDTGVGKTHVSLALIAALQQKSLRVDAWKPCETGDGDDADRLGRAVHASTPAIHARFAMPAAPLVAARHESQHLDPLALEADYRARAATADVVIVEGAGGLLVPLTETMSFAELAMTLGLHILIVARPNLGTINHTRLTIEAARARQLPILGFVFSRIGPPRGPDEPTNAAWIAQLTGVPFLGTHRASIDPQPADLQLAAATILATRH